MKKNIEELKLTGRLPSPAGVGVKILQLTQNEEYSTEDLSRTIQSDPALSGRIIRMANSALAGGAKPCSTVSDAVVRLGASAVRNLALGFSLISAYRQGQCASFDFPRFWSDSLGRAIAAQEIARSTRATPPAEAYICGLLSNIGRLALACVHPELYSDVLRRTSGSEDDQALITAERAAFDTDHCELGRAILDDWKLPASYGKAISTLADRRACEDDDATSRSLRRVVSIAAAVAAVLCEQRESLQMRRMQTLLQFAGDLKLDKNKLWATCDAAAGQWSEWARLLRVPAQVTAPFATLAANAENYRPEPLAKANVDPAVPEPHQKISQITCLVADDDATVRKVLTAALTKHGFRVVQAANGVEGLRVALETNPHVVIVDWQMPEMDGIEFTRQLRRTEIGRDMHILMLTGRDEDDQLVVAFDAGVDDFVAKPINFKIMMARVAAGERTVRLKDDLAAERRQIERQIAELAILNRRLETLSITDALTGLPNRRFALDALAEQWKANETMLSVMVVDVDHFKKVNDSFGHDVGDEVLRAIATQLKAGLRVDDVVCRLGGEEFLVICPACPGGPAMAVAERMRQTVENHRVRAGGFDRAVTVSIGVAERAVEMRSPHELLKMADQALYDAKSHGRNRVSNAASAMVAEPA